MRRLIAEFVITGVSTSIYNKMRPQIVLERTSFSGGGRSDPEYINVTLGDKLQVFEPETTFAPVRKCLGPECGHPECYEIAESCLIPNCACSFCKERNQLKGTTNPDDIFPVGDYPSEPDVDPMDRPDLPCGCPG